MKRRIASFASLLPLMLAGAFGAACAQLVGLEPPGQVSSAAETPAGDLDGGTMMVGDLQVTPQNLLFHVDCSPDKVSERPIHLVNAGKSGAAIHYELTPDPTASFLSFDGKLSDSIPFNGSVDLKAKATLNTFGDINSSIKIKAGDDGDGTMNVVGHVAGGVAVWDAVGNKLSLGEFPRTIGATTDVTIHNDGDKPFTLENAFDRDGDDALAMSLDGPKLEVKPGEKGTIKVTLVGGKPEGKHEATFRPHVTEGVVCGQLPTLTVDGTLLNTSVSVVPPQAVTADCGSNPPPIPVRLQNYSKVSAVPYEIQPIAGGYFTVSDTGPGSVPPSSDGVTPGEITIKVQPGPVTADLSVKTAILGILFKGAQPDNSGTKSVSLSLQPSGAVLTFNPTSHDFSAGSRLQDSDYHQMAVANTGNKQVNATFTITDQNGGHWGFIDISGGFGSLLGQPPQRTLAPNGQGQQVTVDYYADNPPPDSGPPPNDTAKMTVTIAGAPVCATNLTNNALSVPLTGHHN